MRLTTVLLIASLMQVSAAGFAQKVTLSEKSAALVQVFDKISSQTGYDFLFTTTLLKNARPVTIQANNANLDEVLKQIFEGQPFQYTIGEKSVVVKEKEPSFLDKVKNRFFDISVSGVVLDSAGKALPGASVTVKGTLKAVTTGEGGSFFIQNIKENSILIISYIGYETQEVVPVPNTLMQIRMISSASKLQEVIINAGYYTVKEAERTGSISRTTSKEIGKQPVTNVLAAMQGQMSGVNITQVTGTPGGTFKIEIRGRNSLQGNNYSALGSEPLYIIDGTPYSTQDLSSGFISDGIMGGQGVSPLNSINPADIENIEVLKDADATAIYGSRGANGVVLITTKKGKIGKTEFSLNAYSGTAKVTRRLDLMNTQQTIEMLKEAYKNDGITTIPSWDRTLSVYDQNRYTDWQKEFIGGTAHTNSINTSVSGGNNNTSFLIGGTYYKQGNVFPGNYSYNKGTAHFNINHKSDNQRFSIDFSGSYALDKNDQVSNDLIADTYRITPNAPALYKDNGDLNWGDDGLFVNPLASLSVTFLGKSNTLVSSTTVAYKILPGLQIKANLGYTDTRYTESKTSPHTAFPPFYRWTSANSSYRLNNSQQQSYNIEPQISYDRQISKGKFGVLIGATFLENTASSLENTGTGFASNNLITNLSAATTKSLASSSNTMYRYNAIFGRINYNWDSKYIVNITARRDGSSRFGPGKQFGNFGALGAAWLFSKEPFFNRLIPALNFGKLRASYGTTGSDQIADYGFLNTYSVLTGTYNNYQGVAGLSPTRLYNPNFSWESSKKMDLALDLGFVNDRILLTANYYFNRSSNQLVGIPLPGTTGFPNIQANLDATIQNKGLEFDLRSVNIKTRNLSWTTTVNLTLPRQKLISFPGLEGSTYASFYIVGKPLNIRQLYRYTGVDPQTGLYTFQDYNGGGVTSADDRKQILDISPKYFGGITNNLRYKNIELNFVLQFVKQVGQNYISSFGLPGQTSVQPIEVLDRWQKAGDKKQIQRFSTGVDDAAYVAFSRFQYSDAAFTDASFIRLKNISLAYTLPKSILKGVNCRVYLQGQNILTITRFKGLDPENQTISVIPPLRVITAGLQMDF